MNIYLTPIAPEHGAIHVDLAGREPAPKCGASLTLTDPDEIIAAARAASRHDADWVLWRLATMPCAERRAAAFVIAVARALRGRVFVVIESTASRDRRIAGHLLRAGAQQL